MKNNSYIATAAIFDVDETLINIKSMFSFLEFWLIKRHGKKKGINEYEKFYLYLREMAKTNSREDVNREFYRVFSGYPQTLLYEDAAEWFDQLNIKSLFIEEIRKQLDKHRGAGHYIILISGSADFILTPLAQLLYIDKLFAIKLANSEDGICIGIITGEQTIGVGKRRIVEKIRNENPNIFLFGYGDHSSDIPMLSACDIGFMLVPSVSVPSTSEKGILPFPIYSNHNFTSYNTEDYSNA